MLKSLIVTACLAMGANSGQIQNACTKSFEASAIQSGVSNHFQQFEQYLEEKAKKETTKIIPDKDVRNNTQAVAAVAYILAIKRELEFQTCAIPMVDTTRVNATQRSFAFSFIWRF